MIKESIFLISLMGLILFNGFVVLANPTATNVLDMNYTNLILTAITILTGGGLLSIFVSGELVKFGISILLIFNIMFSIDMYGYSVGLGLINNAINVFSGNTFADYVGLSILGILSFISFASAILILVDGG